MKKDGISNLKLAKKISDITGIPITTVKAVISQFYITLSNGVSNNDRIVLKGFGTFYLKSIRPRKYRTIGTNEIKTTSGSKKLSFRPSNSFKALLRENENEKEIRKKPYNYRSGNRNNSTIVRSSPSDRYNVIYSKPNPKQTDSLTIGYKTSHYYDSTKEYPVIFTPKSGSLLKLPREGRSDIRGYKETSFLASLKESNLGLSISDNMHIQIPHWSIPYEPDIVLFDDDLNLYIDIEIDEPYDGYSRLITHSIEGKDNIRNTFFKESGWIVIRFSEKQVHLQEEECIDTIRQVVNTIRSKGKPQPLSIIKEVRWGRRQAIKWEKERYREKYLGIQSFGPNNRHVKVVCREFDDSIDKRIKRTQIHKPEQVINSSGLSFDEESHTYYPEIDLTGNSDYTSVTTLIEQFFPAFDQESYIKKRMAETGLTEAQILKELAEPSDRGDYLHKQIELFLKKQQSYDDSSKEFSLFLDFYNKEIIARGLKFAQAEYSIVLKDTNIAGTVDSLFIKPNGEYVMIDWKRSKHLIIDGYPKKYGYGRGLSVLSHLDNSSYYKYELQQSFYKYILEKDYGIKVSSMILAVLHPNYDTYYSIKISDYREREIIDIIHSYENLK